MIQRTENNAGAKRPDTDLSSVLCLLSSALGHDIVQRQCQLTCGLPMFQYFFFDHVFGFRALPGLPLFDAHLANKNIVLGE